MPIRTCIELAQLMVGMLAIIKVFCTKYSPHAVTSSYEFTVKTENFNQKMGKIGMWPVCVKVDVTSMDNETLQFWSILCINYYSHL